MLGQFKTADDALWIVDTKEMKWARVSAPPVEEDEKASEVLDSGVLSAQAPYVFALDGRTPDTEGPGAGLCSLMFVPEVEDETVYIVLRTNVEIKDFSLVKPITQIRYQVMNPPKAA